MDTAITIITPTTGKDSLFNLIESVKAQEMPVEHILLWDDKREGIYDGTANLAQTQNPKDLEQDKYWKEFNYLIKSIVIKGSMVEGNALGSALRAIGLMIAKSNFVTFADDDIIWEKDHLSSMLKAIEGKEWAFCKRRIWTKLPDGQFEYLGVDEFESMGEDSKTPYKMVDNNCMIFKRRFGTSAAVLYRETREYNDDRLMYGFLKKHAGEPGKTGIATVNQVCPQRLINFFKTNCTK